LRRILELDGHAIMEAQDGSGVMDVLQANRIDLMLTDILMPGWNGLRTISEVRRYNSDMKIVAMSGSGASCIPLADASRLGADAAIAKPFSPSELRALIAGVMSRTRE
jgi:DNA-binding response OmpR family regulator